MVATWSAGERCDQLTMLAYDMNDEPLPYGHGAPLWLRNEVQLGFKKVRWPGAIELVADFAQIGSGPGTVPGSRG